MNSAGKICLCVGMSLRKEFTSIRVLTVYIICFIFHYYTFDSIPLICEYLEITVSPWVFPFFLGSPTLFIIYGALAILLFCKAPFWDRQSPFVMIRVGKRNWIIGQVITILVSSFIYTLWNCACSLLIISPCVAYEAEWGQALYTIASSPEVFRLAGANQAFAPYAAIMELISPKLAMATAIAVFWLCAAMCGMIILCFHIHFGKMSGISICGALTSFAYFSCYLGRLSYGEWMYCISPVNWSCISYLDWFDIGTSQKPQGAVLIYVIVIVCLAAAGCCGFCKKDIMLTDGGM